MGAPVCCGLLPVSPPPQNIKDEILTWLKESFGPIKGRYRFDPVYIDLAFKEESDALMFRLKWVTVITNQKPEYLKS